MTPEMSVTGGEILAPPSRKSSYRKPHRRLTPEEKAVMLEKRKQTVPVVLGPIEDLPDGRKMYHGYEIGYENETYSCLTCGWREDFDGRANRQKRRAIKLHIKVEHLNAYVCSSCEKKFTTQKSLLAHVVKMHPPTEVLHPCPICAKPVTSLDSHLWTHKSLEEKQAAIRSGTGVVLFSCSLCGKEFSTPQHLFYHQSQKNRCKGTNTNNPPDEDFSPVRQKKMTCSICGRELTGTRSLTAHEWTHKNREEKEESVRLGTSPLIHCHVCGKFVQRTSSWVHMETHKEEEERVYYPCEEDGCDKKFTTRISMKRHRKTAHAGVTFKCEDPDCTSRPFVSKQSLENHMVLCHIPGARSHKRFKCDICQNMFQIKAYLDRHLRHHGPQEDYKVPCPHCPALFTSTGARGLHLKIHHFAPFLDKTKVSTKKNRGELGERKNKKRVRKKKEAKESEGSTKRDSSSRKITRSRAKRVKVDETLEEDVDIKCDILCDGNDGGDHVGEEEGSNSWIIKSEGEDESEYDDCDVSPQSEIKSEVDSNVDEDEDDSDGDHPSFKLFTFRDNSDEEDDDEGDEDPLKLDSDDEMVGTD